MREVHVAPDDRGLLPPDAGRVALADRVVDDEGFHVPPENRRVGLVFQDHSLFPHLTVADNVGFGVRGVSRAERARRVAEMLEVVSLDRLGDRYPHELSGGQRQRVAVARALAPEPDLVLLDEPFANLDHNLRLQVRAEVLTALRATGVPAVLVTHDQREALALGDRIGVMRAGRLVQIDRPEVVFHRPANRFVGAFLGEASFLPVAVADDGTPATDLGPVDQAGAGIDSGAEGILAMVRPDDLTFRPDERGDAEILSAGYQGVGWLYTVGLPSGHVLAVQEDHLATFAVGTRGTVTMTPGHRQVLVPDA